MPTCPIFKRIYVFQMCSHVQVLESQRVIVFDLRAWCLIKQAVTNSLISGVTMLWIWFRGYDTGKSVSSFDSVHVGYIRLLINWEVILIKSLRSMGRGIVIFWTMHQLLPACELPGCGATGFTSSSFLHLNRHWVRENVKIIIFYFKYNSPP